MDKGRFLKEMVERTAMFFSDHDLGKIESTTIAIAGFGGVGAIVLELLVRLGVMRFRLMDMDRYEISNMNRQVFATTSTLGSWKVDVAASRIKEINPFAEVEMLIKEKADRENVERFVKGVDVLIQETDSPSSKFLFLEYAREYNVPLINGHCESVVGGIVHVYDYRNPRQRDGYRLFRLPTLSKMARKSLSRKYVDEVSDEYLELLDRGKRPTASLNFVTNLIGCLVVSEAVKLITGMGKTYAHPREIFVSLPDLKMKVRSTRPLKKWLLSFPKVVKKLLSSVGSFRDRTQEV
jgi:molybdopterin/thiamine biosynthesis adenylyltransferase